MYFALHVKYPLFVSIFNETLIILAYFRKIQKISNFMKILPVGAELFHAERRPYGQTGQT
jgi:hypothetical protein